MDLEKQVDMIKSINYFMGTIYKLLMATAMLLAFRQPGLSQEAKTFKTHEISIGAAPVPVYGRFTPELHVMEHGENESVGDIHGIPLCTISYNHFHNKWFSFNIRSSVSGIYYYVYPDDKSKAKRFETFASLSVIGMAQFTYLNRDAVRLYSSIGLGMCACLGLPLPTAQLAVFGVSFGKRVFGFMEIGSGTEYRGCYGGVGYRF